MALYFALSNLAYVITLAVTFIGIVTSLKSDNRTTIFMLSMLVMNISMVISAYCLYMFCSKLTEISTKRKYAVGIIGLLIIIFSVAIYDNYLVAEPEGFQIKYVASLFLTIYSIGVFISIIRIFGKDFKNLHKIAKEFRLIVYGTITMMVFFIAMLLRAAMSIDAPIYVAFVWLTLVLGVGFYFFGFIRPSIQSVTPKEEKNNTTKEDQEYIAN